MPTRHKALTPCPVCGRDIARRGGRLVTHYPKPLTTQDLVEITFGRMVRPDPCPGSKTKAATRKAQRNA